VSLTWYPTPLPTANSRTDDVWFHDDLLGWAVNSDGKLFRTRDGAQTWEELQLFPDSYLRCVTFSSPMRGWIGTLSGPHRLYATEDGGETWQPVRGLPDNSPARICGLIAVTDDVVFAAGTNYPDETAGVLRSTDGGNTWTLLDLGLTPALLVDIFFQDERTGWVVGGVDEVLHPDRDTVRRDVVPVVLATEDGGATWRNAIEVNTGIGEFPRGEWGWKIQKLGESTLLVSLENLHDGAILRSNDLGQTWERLAINDRQRNANLEGIGFLDDSVGWVGGWGDLFFQGGYTSETLDGGKTWNNANHVGFRLNRFRFIGDPVRVAYASGDTVYKLAEAPIRRDMVHVPPTELAADNVVTFDIDVPEGTERLEVRIWERFGREVRHLLSETAPATGTRKITWDFADERGETSDPGSFIVRIVTDDTSVSQIVHHRSRK